MKKLFLTSATFVITLALAGTTSATDFMGTGLTMSAPKDASQYRIIVNGQNTNLDFVVKGPKTDLKTVMVPVRGICEKLGFTVTWNKDKTVTLDNRTIHSTITIGEDTYKVTVNDNQISIQTEMPEIIQIPNPLTKHTTIEALKKAVSFNFVVPTLPAGYKISLIQDISGDLAEIRFSNDNNTINYRVSAGSEDNSGNSIVYDSTQEISVNGSQITCKGNGGTISLAVWEKDGFSYSLSSNQGLTTTQMKDIIESIR